MYPALILEHREVYTPEMMTSDEKTFLKVAYQFLENPSFVTRVSDYLGKPLALTLERLPYKLQNKIASGSVIALKKSVDLAHRSLFDVKKEKYTDHHSGVNRFTHNLATMATGFMGGFFGGPGVILELPITTTLIMRSILAQGKNYEHISKEELIANSLYVFSLGSSQSKLDDEMDSAYYSSRVAMDLAVKKAAEYLAGNAPKTILKGLESGTAPMLLELIKKVAARFKITVTEKMLAEALPIVGAAGGAGINLLFNDFFTLSAKYHFGIKNLEAKYGKEVVEKAYKEFKN